MIQGGGGGSNYQKVYDITACVAMMGYAQLCNNSTDSEQTSASYVFRFVTKHVVLENGNGKNITVHLEINYSVFTENYKTTTCRSVPETVLKTYIPQ